MRSVAPGDVIFSFCDTRIKAIGVVGPTFRDQVVTSRRGQGVFRANVLLRESSCQVTRVDDSRHLKASHIKPWRDAADAERLDGSNGLVLSPHITQRKPSAAQASTSIAVRSRRGTLRLRRSTSNTFTQT